MRYVEWVEVVLRCVIANHSPSSIFGMDQIGRQLGLDIGNWGDPEHRDIQNAVAAACLDLEQFDLVDVRDQHRG